MVKIGRNDLCPCGSGKKYKRCCMSNSYQESHQHLSPRFRFESGSYGDVGSYVPSIACLQQTGPNKWDYCFVLVNPDRVYLKDEPAVSRAEKDLEAAFIYKQQSRSDYTVGEYLRNKGYVSVTDFEIIKDEN